MPTLIRDVTIVDAHGTDDSAWVLLDEGTILERGAGDPPPADGATVVEGRGRYLVPGFIDLHVHGGGGHSNEGGGDALLAALASHHRHGTTRAVASFVAAPAAEIIEHLRAAAEAARSTPLLLGSHLEGPFLAEERTGAHDPRHLRDPDADEVRALLDAAAGTLRQVTLDPRRAGAEAALGSFTAAGVVVAVGHTEADYREALDAFGAGATLLTHSFNAMRGIHHREPGPVLAAVDSPGAFLELILDGDHVHPRVARMLFDLAPHRIVLVTDAMAAAGATDGAYRLGGSDVVVREGRATIAGTQTLAGSTLTQDRALRVGLDAGIEVTALIEALTLTPARVLGIADRFGLVAPGYAADVVLLSSAWEVEEVRAEGRLLHSTSLSDEECTLEE
ncbi:MULTISPECIES: N-acetylglucosamine-6-phosphate deacetylase [unclassified Rathayibacter]|uniref:N-acetylglucosamine-6-phosphate deacetylase n=1 Tax=unclassified Rathayibacter TaxID=2609250 RepID=UPI0007004131|nr:MULTISPECIES: N-acetylglucosamine-6-phosphate deacetylase [unclassified Rathayibacter]KQQ00707.1 hypothetical protein ASF42_15370 [Rathayibacter sp. Leaf294]KQS10906.1 hypothetical protein ASG06_15370 [Rathayibacter sp. Leaf185]